MRFNLLNCRIQYAESLKDKNKLVKFDFSIKRARPTQVTTLPVRCLDCN